MSNGVAQASPQGAKNTGRKSSGKLRWRQFPHFYGRGRTSDDASSVVVRWPTPSWVQSLERFKHFAIQAGDTPDSAEGDSIPPRQEEQRKRNFARTIGKNELVSIDADRGVHCKASVNVDTVENCTGGEQQDGDGHVTTSLDPSKRTLGRKGETGLRKLENDFRQAAISVWLAWGVRIDAVRAQQEREERTLRSTFQADIEQLESIPPRGGSGDQARHGLTPEVLNLIAREGVLTGLGCPEEARELREEALLAMRRGVEERRGEAEEHLERRRRILKEQHDTRMRVLRSSGERRERILRKKRDDTVRLLKLHRVRVARILGMTRASTRDLRSRVDSELPKGGARDDAKGGPPEWEVYSVAVSPRNKLVTQLLDEGLGTRPPFAVEPWNAPAMNSEPPNLDKDHHGHRPARGEADTPTTSSSFRESPGLISSRGAQPRRDKEGPLSDSTGGRGGDRGVTFEPLESTADGWYTCPWPRKQSTNPRARQRSSTFGTSRPAWTSVQSRTHGRTRPSSARGSRRQRYTPSSRAVPRPASAGTRPDAGGDLRASRVPPEDTFCSWECVRRWSARFSPTQLRHERGLRIDIAAGRLVS